MNAAIVFIFSALLIYIGWAFGDDDSVDGYTLASRSAKALFIAFGVFTVVGASTFIGVTQYAYSVAGYASALGVGAFLGAIALAWKKGDIQRIAARENFVSLPDVVAKAYGRPAGLLVSLISVAGLGCLLLIQISAGGLLIALLTGVTVVTGQVFIGLVVATYVILGGLKGIFITDVLQGVAMFVMLTALIVALAFTDLPLAGIDDLFPQTLAIGNEAGILFLLVLFFSGFFSISGGADIWLRMFSSDEPKNATKGLVSSGVLFLIFLGLLTYLGMSIVLSIPDAPPGEAFLLFMQNEVPTLALPFIVLGVYAGAISTADAETHVIGAIVVNEMKRWRALPERFLKRNELQISKFIAGLVVVIAIVIAITAGRDLGVIYTMFLSILMASGAAAWSVLLKRGSPISMTLGLILAIAVFSYLVLTNSLFSGANSLLIPAILLAFTLPVSNRKYYNPESGDSKMDL